MFETRTWDKNKYYENFKANWHVHNALNFIDTNYRINKNLFTEDIVRLTPGTTDLARYTEDSFILGYVRYSSDECRFRIKQLNHGSFYMYGETTRQELLEAGLKTESEKTVPLYFYDYNNRQLFSFDQLEVVGNLYEIIVPKENKITQMSWY